MAKENESLLRQLAQFDLYKRNQGRITRQVTFAVLAGTVAIGAWRLSVTLMAQEPAVQYGLPILLALAGIWIAFRVVNLPRFADFLVAVEAEMNKVSWPTRDMLFRSSMVVMFTIFTLAFILFLYDIIWSRLLSALGISGA